MQAFDALLAPLARLAVGRGMRFAVAEELFKRAFVQAARSAHSGTSGARDVSRVATTTGLTRREVSRLSTDTPASAATRRSPATEVFTRWTSSRKLLSKNGEPRPLPRQGPAPSFDALAQSVTRDVHPRSVLDELCRLGLVRLDADTDTVHLLQHAFVPSDNDARMVEFLGRNVGDHLSGAVANVLAEKRKHFEQAMFADELSDESLAAANKLINAQWRALMASVVPELEALIESDRSAKRRADKRLRVGLYSYSEAMLVPPAKPKEP
jgi:Family of unknown function (DUF6502)